MPYGESLTVEMEAVASDIVDAAYRVHLAMGPGLLESVYEICLAAELAKRGRNVVRQMRVPIVYGNVEFDEGFRIDLLVDDCVVVEVKAVERLGNIHAQQVKTYLRLARFQLGILINFNVEVIRDGIKRVINTKP